MDDIFRKLNIHFDIEALRKAYERAAGEIGFSGELVNCISLTHKDSSADETRGIFWTRNNNYEEIQIERFVDETAYKVFEPLLMDSYFKNVYDVLSRHFTLGRVRILKLNPRTCLSYHRDPENRLHIPIITNPGALMVVNNECLHMKADGDVYQMKTMQYHTALNGGDIERIHLVATILDENPDDELYTIYGGD